MTRGACRLFALPVVCLPLRVNFEGTGYGIYYHDHNFTQQGQKHTSPVSLDVQPPPTLSVQLILPEAIRRNLDHNVEFISKGDPFAYRKVTALGGAEQHQRLQVSAPKVGPLRLDRIRHN